MLEHGELLGQNYALKYQHMVSDEVEIHLELLTVIKGEAKT